MLPEHCNKRGLKIADHRRSLAGLAATGVGDGLVDHLEELAAVNDLDEGRSLAVGGDHPDGRRVLNADALAQCVVGLDQAGELALGIDGEGQCEPAALGERFSVLGQIAAGIDGDLVGEDVVAIVVADLLALGVEPAGVDRRVEAPVMEGEREVVADPGECGTSPRLLSAAGWRVSSRGTPCLRIRRWPRGHRRAGEGPKDRGPWLWPGAPNCACAVAASSRRRR